MTELLACIIGWAIGTFLVGVIIGAFIAAIYSNITEDIDKENEEGVSLKTEGD